MENRTIRQEMLEVLQQIYLGGKMPSQVIDRAMALVQPVDVVFTKDRRKFTPAASDRRNRN